MKKSALVVGLVAALVVAAGGYVAYGRMKAKAGTPKAPAVTASASQSNNVELASTDVLLARRVDLVQGLQISGALKAASTALVKARVPGELQGLSVREGDVVKAGQVIARVESSEYASRVKQAQDNAAAAQAQIDIAQRSVDNNRALVNQGFISATALDTSQANLAAARANHQAALAAVEVAKKAVEDTALRAPISGQVASRGAQNGERVGVDARIVEIVDLSKLELEAAIPTADSAALRIGQTAELQIEGLTQKVQAVVARISPSAQSNSRSVLTYLSVAPQPGLRQGLFAQGVLGTARLSGVAVPVGALRTDKPEPFVQVVQEGKLAHVKVQISGRGELNGQAMVALSGLAEGAQVVAGHIGMIREGVAVSFTAASGKSAAPQ